MPNREIFQTYFKHKFKKTLKPDSLPASSTLSRAPIRARQARASRGAEIIRQRIKTGVYKPGEQLPSLRVLSAELNLSFPAMQRAVRLLEKEAILESRHGVGIRILESADCGGSPLFFGFVQPYFSRFSLSLYGYLEQALDVRSNLCIMKSARNSAARERWEIERLIVSGINGLLIWPVAGDTNGEFLQEVAGHLPVVFVDRTLDEVKAPAVVLDCEGVTRRIIRQSQEAGRTRVLAVCDPSDISTFHQLKRGMREEAAARGMSDTLTILDYPVVPLIESYYANDYALADACYADLAPLLQSGDYDVLFCPQSEFFDQVFADCGRTEVLSQVHCITLETPDGPPHSRRYHEMKIEKWTLDTAKMLVTALDLLQDATITRESRKRRIYIPITRQE